MRLQPQTYKALPRAQLVPSAESAIALMRGEPGALWAVLAHTATRAVVMAPLGIAVGALVKVRPMAAVAVVLGGAVAIEIGVLALAYRQVRDEAKTDASEPVDAPADAMPAAA